jgi:phage gp36-like protein
MSYYAQQSDIENLFGIPNVAEWSNLAGLNDYVDTNRIGVALAYADSEINNFFQGGPYAVPLSLGQSAPTITNWAAVIAGVWLYTSRGQLDTITNSDGTQRVYNKYSGMLKSVYADMGSYRTGQGKRLDSAKKWPVASSVMGVCI